MMISVNTRIGTILEATLIYCNESQSLNSMQIIIWFHWSLRGLRFSDRRRFFFARHFLLANVILEHLADELSDSNGIGVDTDDTTDENAVSAEIIFDELVDVFAVRLLINGFEQVELFLDVAPPVLRRKHTQGPPNEGEDWRSGNDHQPEPNKQEDHLVEQIDRKDTLDCVADVVTQHTNDEIAHGDTGEPWRIPPICSVCYITDYINAVEVEILSEEGVHQKELSYDIDDVQKLAHQETAGQVVAGPPADAANTG